jgi:hypothetical protein
MNFLSTFFNEIKSNLGFSKQTTLKVKRVAGISRKAKLTRVKSRNSKRKSVRKRK